MESFYSLSALDNSGKVVKFSDFKGKACIVVNTALNCGLNKSMMPMLANLADKYDLRVLAFPCNQFMGQEPREACEIKDIIASYSKKIITFDKIDVNGKNRHQVFKFLIDKQPGFITNSIKWNYTKFLINTEGEVVKRYGPTEKIDENSEIFKNAIGQ